jgi:hypothetical protein
MKTNPGLLRSITFALASMVVYAAGAQAATEAQTRYLQEMAVCNSGKSNQEVGTCRREARNALAESRRNGLTNPGDQMQHNMLMRCGAHEGVDRRACEMRMGMQGTTEGSVGAGGILRQSTVTVPSN